jgi:hypothetical protein
VQSPHRILISTAALSALALAGGCRNPVDPRVCPQTYEFGNTGCYQVAGQVVGLQGQILTGTYVRARPVSNTGGFGSDSRQTDAAGRFQVRAMRVRGRPPADGSPDTLSVWVIASDVHYDVIGNPVYIRDSVFTTITVAPVGAAPLTTEVLITLPEP